MSERQNEFGNGEFINNSGRVGAEAWINVGAAGTWRQWNSVSHSPAGQGHVHNVVVPLPPPPIKTFQVRVRLDDGTNTLHCYRWTAWGSTESAVNFQFSNNPGGCPPTMTAQDVAGNGIPGTWALVSQ